MLVEGSVTGCYMPLTPNDTVPINRTIVVLTEKFPPKIVFTEMTIPSNSHL